MDINLIKNILSFNIDLNVGENSSNNDLNERVSSTDQSSTFFKGTQDDYARGSEIKKNLIAKFITLFQDKYPALNKELKNTTSKVTSAALSMISPEAALSVASLAFVIYCTVVSETLQNDNIIHNPLVLFLAWYKNNK